MVSDSRRATSWASPCFIGRTGAIDHDTDTVLPLMSPLSASSDWLAVSASRQVMALLSIRSLRRATCWILQATAGTECIPSFRVLVGEVPYTSQHNGKRHMNARFMRVDAQRGDELASRARVTDRSSGTLNGCSSRRRRRRRHSPRVCRGRAPPMRQRVGTPCRPPRAGSAHNRHRGGR